MKKDSVYYISLIGGIVLVINSLIKLLMMEIWGATVSCILGVVLLSDIIRKYYKK